MFLKFQDFKPDITFCHWKSKANKKLQPNEQIWKNSEMSFVRSKQICLWKEKSLRVDQNSKKAWMLERGANTRKHEQITLK